MHVIADTISSVDVRCARYSHCLMCSARAIRTTQSTLIAHRGVILAAIAIWLCHWFWADGANALRPRYANGLLVALSIGLGAIPLIRQSLQILLVPSNHQDLEEIPFHLSNFKAAILPGQKPASTKTLDTR